GIQPIKPIPPIRFLDWQPPFACDVDKLHFTPRIQRLNELEAQTRVKLNFLDQIAKFWELQGSTLKIPHVERKILDLFLLNKLVAEEGGFDTVCKERRWSKVAHKMGYLPGKALGSLLRSHYERILYPYNLFQSGASLLVSIACLLKRERDIHTDTLTDTEKDTHTEANILRERETHTRAERDIHTDREEGVTPRHLRIQSYICIVPFMAGGCPKPLGSQGFGPELGIEIGESGLKARSKSRVFEMQLEGGKGGSEVDLYVCLVCGQGNEEDRLLLCDGCDDSYHTFCLLPPLNDVPKGDWRCPKCLAQECSKPQEAFGFEQAPRDYTLRAFGEMADAFKSDYFNMPVHMVPTELVEKEFWRLVSTIEEDVTVEYGADIASKEFGSGFPIKNGKLKLRPDEQMYFDSGWNLNNMPVLEPSVLTHVSADICGMKLPWLYVGMCFSSFCWHIEDHWSYSINYLHWGEPKTWYGAPAYVAEQLESVMKRLAPELFETQPDLLHQLVTIMNPNTLMAHGVPVYRTNQCAGEFVITFPRAYHSGFNQGFNFAEAVNFCTLDWLPMGRQCVQHYRLLNRYCVFSHDEMICKMASKFKDLDLVLASAVHKDMMIMIDDEKRLREAVRKTGVTDTVREKFELLPDDERQCTKCKTTCFLSAISCPCKPNELVCLYHAKDLCFCAPNRHQLRYRYTLDDLYPMLHALRLYVAPYDEWTSKVTDSLEAKETEKRGKYRNISHDSVEAENKTFPENDLFKQLQGVIVEAEKCASVAQRLLNDKRQTRYRGGKSQYWLTVAELQAFVKQLYALPCLIDQAPLLKDLLHRVEDYQQRSEKALSDEMIDTVELQQLMDLSVGFNVELPKLQCLRERLEQARWLDKVHLAQSSPHTLKLDDMRRLIDSGVGLTPHPAVERAMACLQELLTISEHWEEKAHSLLKARPRHSLITLSAALEDKGDIPTYLPHDLALKETVQKARDWLQEVESVQSSAQQPLLETLVELVSRGRAIPVQLDPLSLLESLLADVESWKESVGETFQKKNPKCSLFEVLCPRSDFGVPGLKRKPKKLKEMLQNAKRKVPKLDSPLLSFNEARLKEMESIRSLQTTNRMKVLSDAECAEVKVCICQKPATGSMQQCELCKDWFHSSCIPAANVQDGEMPWLCPLCLRSERPSLETILLLLSSLERIPVRLPEGEALHYLVERAMNWQHRAKQILSTDELCFTLINSHLANQSWQGITEQIAATELEKRVAENVDFPSFKKIFLHLTYIYISYNTLAHQNTFQVITVECSDCFLSFECFNIAGLCLSDGVRSQLDELMMEALLLQLSLPEMQHIYRILQAAHSCLCKFTTLKCILFQTEGCCLKSVKKDVISEKKRRLDKEAFMGDKKEKLKKLSKPTKKNFRLNLQKSKNPNLGRIETEKYFEFLRPNEALSVIMEPPYSEPEDSEDDDAICPAENCQQPEGDEVDWVQCDGSCNQWFHQICVGVSSETAEKDDYICVSCTVNGQIMQQNGND
uniref:[histone H3]-trimethyl-L-lysine(4) demethylase n=1 Tax=Callorhinchus milii TaxID=7868 RepID=A0A4W3I937_CALMI